MLKIVSSALALLLVFSHGAAAGDSEIRAALGKMDMTATMIRPSPVPGVSAVATPQGVFYISDDGRYLLQGPMFDMSGKTPKNITNNVLLDELNSLENEMIIYKSQRGNHVITVFTDITCPYCLKLHNENKVLNDKGITVRYLAFPRKGPESAVGRDMQSVWCNGFKTKALDNAFRNEPIPQIDSCNIDISKHYNLGLKFGITGTPAIVLEDGTLIAGYLSADKIAELVNK